MKKLLLTLIIFLSVCVSLSAKNDTYIYDFWESVQNSPDTYRVSSVLYADDLKLESQLKNPSSIFCFDNLVFLVDTDNNRILEFTYNENKTVQLNRIIESFNCEDPEVINTFNSPHDIFINQDKTMFVADTNNNRVVKLDFDLNYIMSFVEPDNVIYDKEKSFFPEKVVADRTGRLYVLAKNVNKGFVKYEADGSFTNFFGATKVTYNWTDYLWKKYFTTKAQREQMVAFVPTEYSNAYIDSEGFVYCVTKTFEEWDLRSGKAQPLRRLNALGDDILIKEDEALPIGDLQFDQGAGIKGPSHFSDVTVLDNEVYLAMDETRGRIFAYNNQGNLLFAFGNKGNIDGYFRSPAALDHVGKDLFVVDSINSSVTIFTPTEYGNLIYEATEYFNSGEYDKSAEAWKKVLELNGNYDLAYLGLGKAAYRKENYKEAMHYFKVKRYRRKYSKAFEYYRKEWVEQNLFKIVLVILALILIPLIVKIVKRVKSELESL
ncbi:MAG: hypothetical protein IKX23_08535 [Treponema sp.]|nr:hypothetical protein [Treponema sp.]